MAIMISNPSRSTDIRANLKEAVRLKTIKLRTLLVSSTLINCILLYFIFRKYL